MPNTISLSGDFPQELQHEKQKEKHVPGFLAAAFTV